MKVQRGDVVLVVFPFASGKGSKRRPALVVQNDRNNQRMANTILAAITTTLHRSGEPTQVIVDPAATVGQGSGLLMPSVVSCENLLTIDQRLIQRVIGTLPAGTMRQVDSALKAALGVE